jgi:ComF family protein
MLSVNEINLCNKCYSQISSPTEEYLNNEFERKFKDEQLIDDFFSVFMFEKEGPLQSLIHELKYKNKFTVGYYLGKQMALLGNTKIKTWQVDFIIPVPLHILKKTERGYNQSYYIAKGLSKEVKIPVKTDKIKRRIFTKSQATLSANQRKQNIKGAFSLNKKNFVNQKRVLLIDDVITTGATVSACGEILKKAGAQKVFALSTAIAGY